MSLKWETNVVSQQSGFPFSGTWGCRAQSGGQAWVGLECHDVPRFTKTPYKQHSTHSVSY